MKQYYNRIGAVLLAVLLSVSLLCVGAPSVAAAEGTCGEGLTWVLADGCLTVSGRGAMTDYTEDNMPPWLEYADQIQRVVLEHGVSSVGDLAFYHCTALTSVSLPGSVQTIGVLAMAGCTSLTRITLPAVIELRRGCFYECLSLVNVVLPETLRVIDEQAFYRCVSLGGIVIPYGVQTLGNSAFAYCHSLQYVRIESPITELPDWCFYSCEELSQLYLPDTVETVGDDALTKCESLYYVDGGAPAARPEIQQILNGVGDTPSDSPVQKDVTYTQTDGAIITTTENTLVGDVGDQEDPSGTYIQATVTDPSGWNDVVDAIAGSVDAGKAPTVTVQLQGNTAIPEGALDSLADREVTITIRAEDGSEWKVVLGDQTADTYKKEQNLGVTVEKNTKNKYKKIIGDAVSYFVTLGDSALNTTVSIPLGKEAARQTATFYRIKGSSLEKLTSVLVDDNGRASFRLGNIGKGKYLLALNVADLDPQEVLIPETMAPQYDITYGSTLTDAEGNQYVLVGRVNKLGISLGTLTLIVVGVLVGSALLIGGIMTIWNKKRNGAFRPQ